MQETLDSVVQLADRRVDLVRQQVLHADGSQTALTTREAQLLAYLCARAEVDVSRDELLDQVWEYRATYATRAVDVAMRRLRSKIEPDPANPTHLISVHGVGYRFVPAAAEEVEAFVTPAPAPMRTTNLRAERSAFFGREAELSRLGELYNGGARLIAILGPGGVGKTRLAMAAAKLAQQSADGVWVVDLTESRGIDGVLAAVGKTLGVPLVQENEPRALIDFLGRALATRGRLLLVLDNAERVVDAAPATIGRWLELAPECRFLVTSRERLRVQGEVTLELSSLTGASARALFLDRAAAVGADLHGADPALIDHIIQRLDGLPLAIELAAPRARTLSLEQLSERLSQRFRVLVTPQADGPTRQSTLRHAIDGSWDALTHHEREALAQCSVFAGGFSLESAEAVISVGDDAPWTLDLIDALRDKSLLRVVEPDDLPGELRFGMYESIREYAAEKLGNGTDATARRHAEHMLTAAGALARGVEAHGGLSNFLQLAVETDNLLAVHDRMLRDQPAKALQALVALAPILRVRGPMSLYRRMLDHGIDFARGLGDGPLLARLLLDRVGIARISGQLDAARTDLGDALVLVRESQTELEVDALSMLAMVNSDQSRFDEAEVIATTARDIAVELNLTKMRGVLAAQLGTYLVARGRNEEAEALYLEAIQLQLDCGHERGAAAAMGNLAQVLGEFGRLDEATSYAKRGIKIHQAWGDRRGRATLLMTLAGLEIRRERLEQALTLIDEACPALLDVGYVRLAAVARMNRATVRWALGKTDGLLQELQAVVDVQHATGDRLLEAMALGYLAARRACVGDLVGAREAWTSADELLHGLYVVQAAGVLLLARGFIELAEARASSDPMVVVDRVASAREKAEHGQSSAVMGIHFLARLLARELGMT